MKHLPRVFILITVVIDAMGIGLILPVMPDLIKEVQGSSLANAAVWGGILSMSFAVMQFLFGPLVGNLSDRFGRRPVLLISLTVMTANYIVMAIAGKMWLLLVGRIIGGITAATQSTANAYMADISKPEEKSVNFGLIGAAFGLGFVIGPIIGGVLGGYGPRAPFYAAALLAASNAVFGFLVLKETVTDEIRRPFDWRRANPLGALLHIKRLPGIGSLMWVYFLYSVAFYVYPSVWAYFTRERFDWDSQTIGISLALFGIGMAVVQGFLIRFVLRWFGEAKTVIYGLGFDIVAFSVMSLVRSGPVAIVMVPLGAIGSVVTPPLQGIMSRRVGDNEQGELQGIMTSINALATVVSPPLMTSTFAAFTRTGAPIYFPGAPFVVATLLMFVALLVFLGARRQLGAQ